MKAKDVYRTLKMVGTGLVAALAYFYANMPGLPPTEKVILGAIIAGLVAVGAYVTPSPIHQADLPAAIGPDMVEPQVVVAAQVVDAHPLMASPLAGNWPPPSNPPTDGWQIGRQPTAPPVPSQVDGQGQGVTLVPKGE